VTARLAWLALVACAAHEPRPEATTGGAIAVANLDHLIAQRGDDPAQVELLLVRARFLADPAALDRAAALAEDAPPAARDRAALAANAPPAARDRAALAANAPPAARDRAALVEDAPPAARDRAALAAETPSPAALVRRAQARGAVHRFADALADLAAAERAGAEVAPARAAILVATGDPAGALPLLVARPDYAHRAALAGALAALGAFAAADALYAAADDALDTTSPFPHAWLDFARGLMWAEQAGDPARGERHYRRAVARLPAFAPAQLHLAELEAARGDRAAALARLAPLDDPEALGLRGALHVRAGDPRGWLELTRARARCEALVARHPLAYADHAAELQLAPGGDRARAWQLARVNLANRATRRAWRLALTAAIAAARWPDAVALTARTPASL
jgi:hypothetical protein